MKIASLTCMAAGASSAPHPSRRLSANSDCSTLKLSYLYADENENQLIDIYLPTQGEGPYPALVWFGGIWKAAKHPANLGFFLPRGIAVIAVETRTMEDATAAREREPASYVQSDAIRAVQFVRHHAAKWNLDPRRLATGGGSQGAQPAFFVGCSRDWANAASNDPVGPPSLAGPSWRRGGG